MINRYPLLKVFCIRNDSMRDQNEDSVACSDGNLRSPLAHLECMDPSWSKQKRYGGVLKYGYPKSSTLRGFSIVNYPRYGGFPIFENPQMCFFSLPAHLGIHEEGRVLPQTKHHELSTCLAENLTAPEQNG